MQQGLGELTVAAVAVGAAIPGRGGRMPLRVDHLVHRASFPGIEEERSRKERGEEHKADQEGSKRA